jgi:hypothetical protein
MNHYLIFLDLGGNKVQFEVKADNELHAKKIIKQSLKFDKIMKCEAGTLQRFAEMKNKQDAEAE